MVNLMGIGRIIKNYIYRKKQKIKEKEVKENISDISPHVIIHLAANVGGLFKNMYNPVEMYELNILINTNLLKAAHSCNIQNVISCLSTCIFPDNIKYPINEDMLNMGPPHDSNFAYAYAKRMLDIHSRCYRLQYQRNYICIIPTNIYGPNDNFSLEEGHVIPSLIHKCYLSKLKNEDFMVKGTGNPLRQFIYSEDLAKLILLVMQNYKDGNNIILSVPEEDEVSIKDIAELISKNFNYQKRLKFDKQYSDGQFKKTADNSKLVDLIKDFKFTSIDKGINQTIVWFLQNYNSIRK